MSSSAAVEQQSIHPATVPLLSPRRSQPSSSRSNELYFGQSISPLEAGSDLHGVQVDPFPSTEGVAFTSTHNLSAAPASPPAHKWLPKISHAHSTPPDVPPGYDTQPRWWMFSIEETLEWPTLKSHGLQSEPLVSVIDCAIDSSSGREHDPAHIEEIIPPNDSSNGHCQSLPHGAHTLSYQQGSLDDVDQLTALVRKFLKHVHVKNPLLEPSFLHRQIAIVAEAGLDWDAGTCLLLTVCAVGAIVAPYDVDRLEDYSQPSITLDDYLRSREYFHAAKKRLGFVTQGIPSLIGIQCLFFASGYHLLLMQPFAAWRSVHSASVMCQHYLTRLTAGGSAQNKQEITPEARRQQESLQSRLYWCCVKSEREIAIELGLDVSSQGLLEYSTPLLSPHTPPIDDLIATQWPSLGPEATSPRSMHDWPARSVSLTTEEYEQGWFYYLTDVTVRKLELQIDAFFRTWRFRYPSPLRASSSSQSLSDDGSRINMDHGYIQELVAFHRGIIDAAAGADQQIVAHYSNLPPAIAFNFNEPYHSADDLREYLRLRMLAVRRDLTRPALYFMLHPWYVQDLRWLAPDVQSQVIDMANRNLAMDSFLMFHGLSTHRHPGTWLGMRYCVRAALELFAASKARASAEAAGKLGILEGLAIPQDWRAGLEVFKRALKYWRAECKDATMYLGWILGLEQDMGSEI